MSHDLRKVRSGQKLEIPAKAYNAFVDAAIDLRQRSHGTQQQSNLEQRSTGIMLVRNNSGEDMPRLSVLGLDAPVVSPTDNLQQFKNRAAMSASKPQSDHQGRFVILLDAIRQGAIGRAYVSGVCPAYVYVESEYDGFVPIDNAYADITENDASKLTAKEEGSAQILWREGGTGDQWAIVRLTGPNQDKLVAVDEQQTPGYLEDQFENTGFVAAAEDVVIHWEKIGTTPDKKLKAFIRDEDIPIAPPYEGDDIWIWVDVGMDSQTIRHIGPNTTDPYQSSQAVVVDVETEWGLMEPCRVRVYYKDHTWDSRGHTLGYFNATDRWADTYGA